MRQRHARTHIYIYVPKMRLSRIRPGRIHKARTHARTPSVGESSQARNHANWQFAVNKSVRLQGNYWGNHGGGEDIAAIVHARLEKSYRRVSQPEDAHLKFIPLQTRNMCFAGDNYTLTEFEGCGINFQASMNLPGMWKWLLSQPSFVNSNGSDHFMIVEPPFFIAQEQVR